MIDNPVLSASLGDVAAALDGEAIVRHSGVLFPVPLGSVRYGQGALADHLDGHLTQLGCSRAFVVTSPSVAAGPAFPALIRTLGPRHAGTFDRTVPQVPREVALDAASAMRAAGSDAVIAIGGGSSVETAKAALAANAIGAVTPRDFDRLPDHYERVVLDQPVAPLVTVPTTLAGAEYSRFASLTDVVAAHKQVFRADELVSCLVILDPEVTVHTPWRLWAETVTKALSDTIDLACSGAVSPVVEPLVYRSIEWLVSGLDADQAASMPARLRTQLGGCMSTLALGQSGRSAGLGASFRHVLGPALGLPHGAVTAMVLPHIYRFNGEAVPGQTHEAVAESLGVGGTADTRSRIEARLSELRESNGLCGRVADFGVALSDDEISDLAERIKADVVHLANPRGGVTAGEIAQILRRIR